MSEQLFLFYDQKYILRSQLSSRLEWNSALVLKSGVRPGKQIGGRVEAPQEQYGH